MPSLSFLYDDIFIPASILVPLTIAFINYSFLDKSLKIILLFNIISAAFNFSNVILSRHGIHTLFLFHIYAIFEFGTISWFYRRQFKGGINKIIPLLILIFTTLCLLNFFYIQNRLELNTYTRSLESIIIISYSVMFLNKQSMADVKYKWASLSINWVNTAFLIFYSCGFFTFMITNYVVNADKSISNLVWSLYDTALLAENILFTIAYYKCKRQPIIQNQDSLGY